MMITTITSLCVILASASESKCNSEELAIVGDEYEKCHAEFVQNLQVQLGELTPNNDQRYARFKYQKKLMQSIDIDPILFSCAKFALRASTFKVGSVPEPQKVQGHPIHVFSNLSSSFNVLKVYTSVLLK